MPVQSFRKVLLLVSLTLIPFTAVYSQVPNLPQGVETENDPGPLFFDVEFYYVRNTFRIGFYTEAGINTVGGAFAGAGIAIGI